MMRLHIFIGGSMNGKMVPTARDLRQTYTKRVNRDLVAEAIRDGMISREQQVEYTDEVYTLRTRTLPNRATTVEFFAIGDMTDDEAAVRLLDYVLLEIYCGRRVGF